MVFCYNANNMTSPTFDTPIQKFLRQPILSTTYIYIDRWSIVHLCSGLILGFLFAKYYRRKQSWLIVLTLLILYEIFERLLDNILFVPEPIVDKIWDIIIGQLGFFTAYSILKTKF